MRELFLDANAHLPMTKPAIDAFLKCNQSIAGHGHALSPSKPGREAEAVIESARNEIAELLGAQSSSQIVFTNSCTQGCEWGLEIFKHIAGESPVYISPTEHPAVRYKSAKLFEHHRTLITNKDGSIDLNYPTPNNSAVISIFVQNEIGIIQPIEKITTNHLFSDMSQAPGKCAIPEFKSLNNLDLAIFGAHKFGGPMIGFFYLKDTNAWKEFGEGSRYFFDRAGSPDACNVVATAAALKYAIDTLDQRNEMMREFRDVLEPGLEELGFEIIGKNSKRVLNTTFARMPANKHSQVVLQQLSNKGIYVGLGSACGSISSGSSPLMRILSRAGDLGNYIRISNFGEYNKDDAKYFLDVLKRNI